MDTYLADYQRYLTDEKHASANTISSYMRDLRQFASYTGERQLELTDVTETRVSTYLDFLSGQGKSPATVSRSLASIKGFYHYLVSKGVMEENPAAHVASVKSEKKLPQVLTGKEVERLLAQPKCTDMKGYRDKAMLELLYATGIRVTELISLNLTDVNLAGSFIHCESKGKERIIPLYPAAVDALAVYMQNIRPKMIADINEQALFVGDILATGFWAAKISEIKSEDTVLIIGAGPTGICTLLCAALKEPKRIIVCEKDPARLTFVREHYPKVLTCTPEECEGFVLLNSDHGGADVVLEVAGGKDTFRLAWRCARPNAIVTVVALYDEAQTLPLPEMYGKNLTFKTGGVDGCDCAEILRLIEQGKLDTTPLITHRFPLSEIEEAYRIFENRLDGVIKVAITADKPQKFGRQ